MKRKLTMCAAVRFYASAFFALFGAALAIFFAGSLALAAVIGGTAGDDELDGTSRPDSIFGHGGNDTVYGRGAADELWGGLDSDTLYGQGNNDTLHGEGGTDTLYGGPGDDELSGNDGVDRLNGGDGGDRLYDRDGNAAERDRFVCGLGNDTVQADPTDRVLSSCENVDFTGGDPPPGAYWQMDETSGPMLDSSGNGNDGTPTDVLRTGSTYLFNGSTSHVTVPDADSLDPRANDITLTASVVVSGGALDDDSYDVVRKGFVTTEGGDYKMEIKRKFGDPTVGKLHCLFRGDGSTVARVARPDVVDGNRHTLECEKTGDSVVARVDGRTFSQAGSAGSIANDINVMVGGKRVSPEPDDMFEGSMEFVSIDIAQ